MTDVLLHPAPGRAAGAWRRPLCRGRPGRLAPASAAAAAPLVRGLDQLPPAGAAELTLFSPSKARDWGEERRGEESLRPRLTRVPAPDQINLFLRVVRRREDGYHDLASLFCVTDFGDTLGVSRSPSPLSDTLVCDAPGVPLDASNLVVRAFDLFRRKTGSAQRFWAHLAKRVPAGAGLGGGSGNAATALWAANVLCGNPATEAQLLEWAGEIGASVAPPAVVSSHRSTTARSKRAPARPPPLPWFPV